MFDCVLTTSYSTMTKQSPNLGCSEIQEARDHALQHFEITKMYRKNI
jgi:hypothetical protein